MHNQTTLVPLEDYDNFTYTPDIELASTLVCKGFEIVSIDLVTPNKATFIFKRSAGIDAVIDDFWGNRLEVKPLEFAAARKQLKSRIYGMRPHKNY